MIYITYAHVLIGISLGWILVRATLFAKNKTITIKREMSLLLVYICFIVVARFTLFPFSKVDGNIQPLIFDINKVFPFRINIKPFIYLFDYPEKREAWLNLIGNTTMFIPLGVVWPSVFKKLDSHLKVIAAGFGVSLFIEILQLPFNDRVSDIDDLILNTSGYVIGYGIYLLAKKILLLKRCK